MCTWHKNKITLLSLEETYLTIYQFLTARTFIVKIIYDFHLFAHTSLLTFCSIFQSTYVGWQILLLMFITGRLDAQN